MKKVWRVYDDRIVKELKKLNYAYEIQAKDIKSDRVFWLYINDFNFQKDLKTIENKYFDNER